MLLKVEFFVSLPFKIWTILTQYTEETLDFSFCSNLKKNISSTVRESNPCQSLSRDALKNWWKINEKKIFASSGNQTRAARVAGEHSTTEPTMPSQYVAEFLDNKQFWFNLALASCFGCTEKASSLQGYPKDLSIKELKDVQCGPSMTSWVDPYPFNELVHTLYWVDPYPFIEGMDQLLNKRVWTQYIIDGPHCMY